MLVVLLLALLSMLSIVILAIRGRGRVVVVVVERGTEGGMEEEVSQGGQVSEIVE